MTKEEIKQAFSMREIVERYGFKPNRAGFILCPFHKDKKSASCKIYKDSFYCFGCHEHGDVFSFIQKMDNCDFKTAFYSLGGEYEKPSRKSKTALYRLEKAREMRKKQDDKLKEKQKQINNTIHESRELINNLVEGSDEWWDAMDAYSMAIIKDINMEGDTN